MMVPNFLYSNSYFFKDCYHLHYYHYYYYDYYHSYFLTAYLFLVGGETTESTIFNISKPNLINILFHRDDCE